MALHTFNRGKLRRLVEAGKVETVSTYSFDDMHGEYRSARPMPVAMWPANWRGFRGGVCYMTEHDFTSKSGRCYRRDDSGAIVTLIVHSNSSYELRIRED
jgi:hypothetical protein